MTLYQKLEYNLELITPTFIGGAFPERQAELRPASFIGILRWWFRNLALTVTDDIDAIYSLESELFGNTEKAGRVWVKFKEIVTQDYEEFKNPVGVNISSLAYLGYGNFSFVNCEKKKYFHICSKNQFFKGNTNIKAFIPSGTTINLTLLVPKKYEKLIKSLLYIVSQFGAIGGRNRRGWGNFYLNPLDKKDYWDSYRVEKAYKNFVDALCEHNIPRGKPAQIIKIYEKRYKKSNYLKVLYEIGEVYKAFRKQKSLKFWNVKSILASKSNDGYLAYNYTWFGLPIQIKPKSKKWRKNSEFIEVNLFQKKNNKEESKRLASPVLFRIFRDTTLRNYGVLLIVFDRKELYREKEGYWFWNFPNREVKAKLIKKEGKRKVLIAEKPVRMDKNFESFINEFLNLVKPSWKHSLTLP